MCSKKNMLGSDAATTNENGRLKSDGPRNGRDHEVRKAVVQLCRLRLRHNKMNQFPHVPRYYACGSRHTPGHPPTPCLNGMTVIDDVERIDCSVMMVEDEPE